MSDAGGSPAAEKPEEEKPTTISIKVKDQQENEVFFKVKRHTKMEKLMGAYAQQQGRDLGSLRFTFEGSRIQKTDTPELLEMDDGDMIQVFQEQLGGFNSFEQM